MEIDFSNIDDLKRRLRKLKKVENRIRLLDIHKYAYVWDSFFNTKDINSTDVKYPMHILVQMTKEQIKAVIDEYFFSVYYNQIRENGEPLTGMYDPDMLRLLDLHPLATTQEVKSRFRELAKKYHPDIGVYGDSGKMVELLDIYNKIKNN